MFKIIADATLLENRQAFRKGRISRPDKFKVSDLEIANFRKRLQKGLLKKIRKELETSSKANSLLTQINEIHIQYAGALLNGRLNVVKQMYDMVNFGQKLPHSIFLAVLSRNIKLLDYLLQQGDNINGTLGTYGYRAIDLAAILNDQEMIAYLTKHGALYDSKNILGATPSDYAMHLGYFPMTTPNISIMVFNPKTEQIENWPLVRFEKELNITFCPFIQTKLEYFEYDLLKLVIPPPDPTDEMISIIEYGGEQNLILGKLDDELGYGVFAGKRFYKGEPIIAYCGFLNHDISSRNPRNPYLLGGDSEYFEFTIDASQLRNLGGMINHSENPNAQPGAIMYKGIKYTIVKALEDIPYGKQICFNYSSCWFSVRGIQQVELLGGKVGEFPTYLPLPALKAKLAGNECFRKKEYQEAIALYSQAITLDPNQAEFYFNRGLAKVRAQDNTANLDFQETLRLDPKYKKAEFQLKKLIQK